MGKGLFHCSRCKTHFYDAEATRMHIADKHGGDGEVLRHPTKKELLIRAEQAATTITALRADLDKARAESERLREALEGLADWAEGVRASGDAGNWEWTQGDEYATARAALTITGDSNDG